LEYPTKESAVHNFRDNYQSILLGSKRWRDSAKESINKGAPFDILTPQKLAEIKSKVFALNHSSIREVFIKLIKIQWPPQLGLLISKILRLKRGMTYPLHRNESF
jgi:hypothetical protein